MEDPGLIMLVQLPLFNRMIAVIVKETVATEDTEDQKLEAHKLTIDINHDYFKILRTNLSPPEWNQINNLSDLGYYSDDNSYFHQIFRTKLSIFCSFT